VQIVQALKSDDKPRRFQSAKDILSKVEADENYLRRWMFGDEVMFYVSGRVNRHNCKILGSENPHAIREIERGCAKVNFWCAFSCSEVFGPFFYAEKTMTAMIYLDTLQLYLLPQMEDPQPDVIFQQDGAPPHFARIFREFLDLHFTGRWVAPDGPILCPPRSPDITPLGFFQWEYAKYIAYKIPVTSLDELKHRFVAAIETVTPQMLKNSWRETECSDILCAKKGSRVDVVYILQY
jgi:hypothetical protein